MKRKDRATATAAVPAGMTGFLVTRDAATGAVRIVESAGIAPDELHWLLVQGARASYEENGDAHSLALDLAAATYLERARLAVLDALEARAAAPVKTAN